MATVFCTLNFFKQIGSWGCMASLSDISSDDGYVYSGLGTSFVSADKDLLSAAGTRVICFDVVTPVTGNRNGVVANPRLAVQQIAFKKVGIGPRGVVRKMSTVGWLDPNSAEGQALTDYANAHSQYASLILQN